MVLVVAVIVVAFYEVRINVELVMATETQLPDPATENPYSRCFAQEDEKMHQVAFPTIDNPDVQKAISAEDNYPAAGCAIQPD